MNYPRSPVKIAAVVVLVACGCQEASWTRHSPPGSSEPATVPSLDVAAISLRLHTPSKVEPGETIPLLLIARNDSRDAVYLGTGDSTTTFDIRVVDRFGRTVWSRMQNRESLASLHEHTLAPGGDLRFAETWDQRSHEGARVPAGVYSVQGTLDVQGETDLKTAPKRLEISLTP
jgi:hypothetical protein